MRNAIVIIYSRGVLQPSGLRRFGNGVSQLSPLRPVLGNGDPLIKILRNALTFERVLKRPAPSHLWKTNRSRMRYLTRQIQPWRLAHGHTCNVVSPTKNPIMKVTADVKNAQATEKTRGSDIRNAG